MAPIDASTSTPTLSAALRSVALLGSSHLAPTYSKSSGSTAGRWCGVSPSCMLPHNDSASVDILTPSQLWPATPTPRPMSAGAYSFGLRTSPAMVPLPLDVASEGTYPIAAVPGKFINSDAIPGKMETCFEYGLIDQSQANETINVFARGSEESAIAIGETLSYFHLAADNSSFDSLGSALHGTGQCFPCAWVWRSSGCKAGSSCNYCHLCPDGELKRRKKEKIAAIRAGERMAAAQARRSSAVATRQLGD